MRYFVDSGIDTNEIVGFGIFFMLSQQVLTLSAKVGLNSFITLAVVV
jgi:hypothetical protein